MAERNERCPCGSGQKYKKCCEAKETRSRSFPAGLALLVGAIVVIAGVGFVPSLIGKSEERKASSSAPAPAQAAAAAPLPANPNSPFSGNAPAPEQAATPSASGSEAPSAAPPGKVWSAEHGHWHDAVAPSNPVQIQAEQIGGQPAAQRVPPEPGMVWSEEHNHWHKAPAASTAVARDAATGAPIGTDPAPAAPNQVRAFGQLYDVTAKPGTPQPPGPVPAGMVWSTEHGHWHDVNTGEAPAVQPQ